MSEQRFEESISQDGVFSVRIPCARFMVIDRLDFATGVPLVVKWKSTGPLQVPADTSVADASWDFLVRDHEEVKVDAGIMLDPMELRIAAADGSHFDCRVKVDCEPILDERNGPIFTTLYSPPGAPGSPAPPANQPTGGSQLGVGAVNVDGAAATHVGDVPGRTALWIMNPHATATLWLGDTAASAAEGAGWPIFAGKFISVPRGEYQGPVYLRFDTAEGATNTAVHVAQPH